MVWNHCSYGTRTERNETPKTEQSENAEGESSEDMPTHFCAG